RGAGGPRARAPRDATHVVPELAAGDGALQAGGLGLRRARLPGRARVRLGAAAPALGAPGLRGGAARLRREAPAALEPGPERAARRGRAMTLALGPEQEAFRHEVADFLEGWSDLAGFFRQDREWPRVRAFFAALGARGWLALGWPREAGGLGRGPLEEFLLWDEVAYRRIARPPLSAGVVRQSPRRGRAPAQ